MSTSQLQGAGRVGSQPGAWKSKIRVSIKGGKGRGNRLEMVSVVCETDGFDQKFSLRNRLTDKVFRRVMCPPTAFTDIHSETLPRTVL